MWSIVNVVQFLFIAVWTVSFSSLTFVLLILTFNQKLTLYLIGKGWSAGILLISGVKLTVTGKENLGAPVTSIYISNHESIFDIFSMFLAAPVALFFIAKKELKKVPLMGWAMAAVGMIFIDRGNHDKAYESIVRAGERVKKGKSIISFPEGTRSRTGEVARFKRGAFKMSLATNIPIVPVAIVGSREVMPSNTYRLRPGQIDVRFGKPLDPQNYSQQKVHAYADAARQAVIELKEQLQDQRQQPGDDAREQNARDQ